MKTSSIDFKKGPQCMKNPGLGVCYSVEYQPDWNWDRDFVKYNKEFSDEHGRLKFRGPYWKVEEWIELSKELGVDFHMAQTKWCDGVCFFETKLTDWKSPEDYVEKFARLSREAGIPFSLYYSVIFDHNPQFDHIQPHKRFLMSQIGKQPKYVQYILGQYREIAEQYKPDSIWLDWYNERTEATHSSIEFLKKNYPDIALGFNQSHDSKKARESLDYTSWEGHFLYKLPELNVLQNNLRKEWEPIARILDPIFSPIFIKFKKSTWDQANRYRREFEHPWDLTSPVGLDWQAPELRDDPNELNKMAAVIMACGGRSNLWGIVQLDGHIREDHLEQLRSVGNWYRPRKKLFTKASPIKYRGDNPPGVGGLPKGWGAIASKIGNDALIHIIKLEGRQQLTSIGISGDEWPGVSSVFLEPDGRELQFTTAGKKIIINFERDAVDEIDTIIRLV